MATNLFQDFPRIAYTLNDFESEEVVVDIFRRVVLSKEFLENTYYYETYEVLHGETPEELSYRFYGTPNLYWLILMVNNIVDPRFEWPLSEDDLYKNTAAKYGSDNVFTINRGVNAAGYQVETFFLLTEDSTHKEPIRLVAEDNNITDGIRSPIAYRDSETIQDFVSNYEVEQNKNETSRSIKIIKSNIVEEILRNFKTILTQ